MLPSSPPTITDLAPKIIASTNKLFFIAYKIGASACHKWRLVRVAFTGSISLYPSAFQDGWVLVKFYVLYPSDVRYNATNQRYWLQYNERNGISYGHLDAHLLTPSDASEDCALRHQLHPVQCWVTLTHGIRTSMGHLTLPPFAAAKLATALALIKRHGMHLLQNP